MAVNKGIEKKENIIKEKCFVIMPISDQEGYPMGHFQKIYDQIFVPAILEANYIPYRVDENKISDSIIEKIFNAIQECPMALCDLSARNPNVLYELGIRQAYDKPVVLVQDEKTTRIFDVSGISTVEYKSSRLYEDVIKARQDIVDAINATKCDMNNTNSLVRLINAKKAIIESRDVSSEDKIEYALLTLTKEVNMIKKGLEKKSDYHNTDYNKQSINNTNETIETMSIYNEFERRIDNRLLSLKELKELKDYFDEILNTKLHSNDDYEILHRMIIKINTQVANLESNENI